ncbi:MAG TPA: DUF1844 domain-containing protein [Verrucomicrobiae bacterium]|jgi:hypothetical protein|nr:DUF1844 domain-containing protein [Verrucomicrobiae bacterium]
MSNPTSDSSGGDEREHMISAMFASLVIQNANMAMIFLGQAPNPQTGKVVQELDNARYFIDLLEMLEVKTKGNLNKQEEVVLKQSLTSLRLAFVEAVEQPQAPSAGGPGAPSDNAPESPAAPETDEQETPIVEPALPGEKTPPQPPAEAESKKKFTKKY